MDLRRRTGACWHRGQAQRSHEYTHSSTLSPRRPLGGLTASASHREPSQEDGSAFDSAGGGGAGVRVFPNLGSDALLV